MLGADRIIELLNLAPLRLEGGYFRRTYLASEGVDHSTLPDRYTGPKPFSSAIYFLLNSTEFSAIHRLRTDEIYHFYLGDPVELLVLFPDGRGQTRVLGHDLESGQGVQIVVPRDVWQGSRLRSGGQFALMGTTMAPAFDSDDFELGDRETLLRQYPDFAQMIRDLTRSERENS